MNLLHFTFLIGLEEFEEKIDKLDSASDGSHPWLEEMLHKLRQAKKDEENKRLGKLDVAEYDSSITLNASWDSDYHSGHRNRTGWLRFCYRYLFVKRMFSLKIEF